MLLLSGMWEAIKTASHGGKSIRRIFIFALVTIVMSFACLFTFTQPTSAIVEPFTSENHTTEIQNLEKTSEENAAEKSESESESAPKTECAIDGIGWIVCPVTTALAGGMDFIYDMLAGFLVVQPASSDDSSALYRAWTYMRSFANIAFVIAFLVIIYSQITSMGVSNYGIKRLLPRLIIAAILVNVSYYICAVAIDIFNILGYSFQDLFMMMREGLIGSDVSYTDIPTWKSVTAAVLSGGTLAGLAIAASAYSVAGLALLLVPALMTCLLAVLVALVVMAARQAIITILVILAPLAFVAYLLPNTEKLFEKWKSAFITLLVLFPAFSVVFGGSQLASIAIIKNANSIAVVILGLLVQVAPLMITPLLIKFGGGLLGKISGMVNNPAKGAFDRVSNMAREKAEINKLDRLSKNPHKANFLRNTQQKLDYNRRNRQLQLKNSESKAESHFIAKRYGSAGANSKILKDEYLTKVMADEASAAKNVVDSNYENYKAGIATDPINGKRIVDRKHPLSDIAKRSESATKDIALTSIATQMAKRKQQSNLSETLIRNEETIRGQSVREYAAGIDDKNGAEKALASALVDNSNEATKEVGNQSQLAKLLNLSGDSRQNLAMGITEDENGQPIVVTGEYELADGTKHSHTFNVKNAATRESMIETQMKIGSYQQIEDLVSNSGGKLGEWKTTVASGVAANGLSSKGIFLAGKLIDDISQGRIASKDDLMNAVNDFIRDGRFKAEDLSNNDPGAIKLMMEAADRMPVRKDGESDDKYNKKVSDLIESRKALKKVAEDILSPDVNVGRNASQATLNMLDELKDSLQKPLKK
jgi:hypothetical protein